MIVIKVLAVIKGVVLLSDYSHWYKKFDRKNLK